MLSRSILNLAVRLISVILKFFFSIFILKVLTLSDLGVYGIIVTSVTLLLFLTGLDFYTFNTRFLLKTSPDNQGKFILNQLTLHAITYILIIPIFIWLYIFDYIDKQFIYLTYFILIFEHLAQEFYRLLITFEHPIFANITLFVRSGFWMLCFIILYWIYPHCNLINIQGVLVFWLCGAFIAFLLAVIKFKHLFARSHLSNFIDFHWIKNGLVVSFPFLWGTLAYKVIEFANRYFIDLFGSKEDVGIFTFFAGIANVVQIFIHSTTIMFYSPKLIKAFNEDRNSYKTIYKQFTYRIIFSVSLTSLAALVAIHVLLPFLNKPELDTSLPVFYILILAAAMLNFSFIPHYNLYVQHKDKWIFKATAVGAIINIAGNIILIPYIGLYAASGMMFISYLLVFILKLRFSKSLG